MHSLQKWYNKCCRNPNTTETCVTCNRYISFIQREWARYFCVRLFSVWHGNHDCFLFILTLNSFAFVRILTLLKTTHASDSDSFPLHSKRCPKVESVVAFLIIALVYFVFLYFELVLQKNKIACTWHRFKTDDYTEMLKNFRPAIFPQFTTLSTPTGTFIIFCQFSKSYKSLEAFVR